MEDEETRRRRGFTSHLRSSPLASLALALHSIFYLSVRTQKRFLLFKFNRKPTQCNSESNLER